MMGSVLIFVAVERAYGHCHGGGPAPAGIRGTGPLPPPFDGRPAALRPTRGLLGSNPAPTAPPALEREGPLFPGAAAIGSRLRSWLCSTTGEQR